MSAALALLNLWPHALFVAVVVWVGFRMERRHMEPAASEPNPAHVANVAAYGRMSKEHLR